MLCLRLEGNLVVVTTTTTTTIIIILFIIIISVTKHSQPASHRRNVGNTERHWANTKDVLVIRVTSAQFSCITYVTLHGDGVVRYLYNVT